jgi:hypothetical protein
MVLAFYVVRLRPPLSDRVWFALALAAWVVLQFLSIAQSRATMTRVTRYLDIHSVGLLLNLAALFYLVARIRVQAWMKLVATVGWTAFITLALARGAYPELPNAVATKQAEIAAQRSNVVGYLNTGNRSILRGKALYDVPHYDIERLGDLLDRRGVRDTLSAELISDATSRRSVQDRLLLKGSWPPLGPAIRRGAVWLGYVLPPIGALLFLLVALPELKRRFRNVQRPRPA